ncbi:MAG: hypothetical protein AUJ75_03655 [Candidatus Omnitrophica bacterium CG1_02_49_10]|nr:MAG: hypothetical protein AUJ75_03655 [Candidatus Omnitrophica bacterium CG1_02_49_10]
MLDKHVFAMPEGIKTEDYIVGLYYMEARTEDAYKKVEAIALEQSTGTWVDVPEETEDIRRMCSAKVLGLYDIPNYEDAIPESAPFRRLVFSIGFPVGNINGQIPQLLTALFGNISMVGGLKLLDVYIPKRFAERYNGPKFGVDGLRKKLKVPKKPIIAAMFKPCVGMSPKTLGRVFEELAMAGVDVIKDDELLADPDFCTVRERLRECVKARERVKKRTGREALYAINISDNVDRMLKKAKACIDEGANCLMVNTYTVGYSALSALAEDAKVNVPLMTHPDFAGTMFMSASSGMASGTVLGKLARLSGSDMVIYPSHMGKVPMVKERLVRVAHELTSPFHHFKSVFPGPSAGMYPGAVGELIDSYGTDVMVAAGGGIHAHPMGIKAGVKAFHQAIDAAMEGVPIEDAAKDKKELKAAVKKWGIYNKNSSIYTLTR